MTEVLKCKCVHEYQDKKYGNHMRVHNETSNNQYRCTVCGNVRGLSESTVKK